MKHFLILIAIFSLMACSSDDNSLSNEVPTSQYTLKLESSLELEELYIEVNHIGNNLGTYTYNNVSEIIIELPDGGSYVYINSNSNLQDFRMDYTILNNSDNSIHLQSHYLCNSCIADFHY